MNITLNLISLGTEATSDVSQRTDLQWAVEINTKLTKAYITKKPYLQNFLINKSK